MTTTPVSTAAAPSATSRPQAAGSAIPVVSLRAMPFARLLHHQAALFAPATVGPERTCGPSPLGFTLQPRPTEGPVSKTDAAGEAPDDRPAQASPRWSALDPTDPMVRSLHGSVWPLEGAAPLAASAPAEAPVSAASRVSLEHVLPRLVRRIAWSGDSQSGTARLEFGEGALAGATLTIHSDRGSVRVALEVPPGVDAEEWKARIGQRLDARGIHVAELEVR